MYAKRSTLCLIGGAAAAAMCTGGMASGGRVALTGTILLSTIGDRHPIGAAVK